MKLILVDGGNVQEWPDDCILWDWDNFKAEDNDSKIDTIRDVLVTLNDEISIDDLEMADLLHKIATMLVDWMLENKED